MHLVVRVDSGGHFWWTLVATQQNRRPVAQGTRGYADTMECERAARQLLRVPVEAMTAERQADGTWRWAVAGADGVRLAESADVFDTAAASGYALHAVREALAGQAHRPSLVVHSLPTSS